MAVTKSELWEYYIYTVLQWPNAFIFVLCEAEIRTDGSEFLKKIRFKCVIKEN
jgi:hypothetical protein